MKKSFRSTGATHRLLMLSSIVLLNAGRRWKIQSAVWYVAPRVSLPYPVKPRRREILTTLRPDVAAHRAARLSTARPTAGRGAVVSVWFLLHSLTALQVYIILDIAVFKQTRTYRGRSAHIIVNTSDHNNLIASSMMQSCFPVTIGSGSVGGIYLHNIRHVGILAKRLLKD